LDFMFGMVEDRVSSGSDEEHVAGSLIDGSFCGIASSC
jgi:hypothetical protein